MSKPKEPQSPQETPGVSELKEPQSFQEACARFASDLPLGRTIESWASDWASTELSVEQAHGYLQNGVLNSAKANQLHKSGVRPADLAGFPRIGLAFCQDKITIQGIKEVLSRSGD